ncbi:unnamed protein product [Ixodes persulcatus]
MRRSWSSWHLGYSGGRCPGAGLSSDRHWKGEGGHSAEVPGSWGLGGPSRERRAVVPPRPTLAPTRAPGSMWPSLRQDRQCAQYLRLRCGRRETRVSPPLPFL